MDRRDFIRLIGLATTCAIIEPSFPVKAITSKTVGKIVPFPLVEKRARFLKISRHMLDDTHALKAFLHHYGIELSNNDPEWEKHTTIQIGVDGEDFRRNLKTVLLTYSGTNPPYVPPTREELMLKYPLFKDSKGNYLT